MMQLNRERVVFLFGTFTNLPDTDLQRYAPLCENAALYVENRLRPDVNLAANMETLCSAAAAWAVRQYSALGTGSASEEIRVGDITLKSASGSGLSELWEIFFAQAAHLMQPEGFVFAAIKEPD